MHKFTCANCKETFNSGWSDEEAQKEYDTSPWNVKDSELDAICDNCFEEFKIWFDTLSEEDHKRIRDVK